MEVDNKKNEPKNVIVETFAGDMANVIESGTGTSVKDIIHGAEKEEAEKENLSPESKENKIFITLGILFLFLALVAFSLLFIFGNNNTVPVVKQFTPLVFSNKSTFLEISGFKKEEITQTILNEINTTPKGDLEGIYLTENKQTIGLRRFITLIESSFAPGDNPLLVSDNFLVGDVKSQGDTTTSSGTGFFILLKMRSSTDIFNSLRAWEPNLLSDLHEFLGINISSSNNYLFTKDFVDGFIENKNARILFDQNGNVVVAYIFADDNSVIVTDSTNAAHEIILRLSSGQTEQ